ncbi:MAG: MarR family transcriptional regulator [Steroidobacteraceae bacterium]
MELTPVMQRYVLHWGEMGGRWGMNRSVAQIHALLYLAAEGLTADEIAATLGIARSNVSVGLRELVSWDLVQVTHQLGDRRDFFTARHDPWEVIRVIVDGRKRREIDPTLALLRECSAQLAGDRATPARVRERIQGQLEFLETVTGWYESVKTLPRKTLLKMMRLGSRIGRVIGE